MRRARGRNKRGAVIVEYAFLLVAVAMPTMFGITVGGMQLYTDYIAVKQQILRPLP